MVVKFRQGRGVSYRVAPPPSRVGALHVNTPWVPRRSPTARIERRGHGHVCQRVPVDHRRTTAADPRVAVGTALAGDQFRGPESRGPSQRGGGMLRPCLTCGVLTDATRCRRHRRLRDQRRGSSTARGYDAAHERLRAEYQRRMDTGDVYLCARCTRPVDPSAWDLGHVPGDKSSYLGPMHITCNRNSTEDKAARQ